VPAHIRVGHCIAHAAEADRLEQAGDGAAQARGVFLRALQKVKRDPLRGLRPDARQSAQLVDQPLDGAGIVQLRTPA